ncbi:unnamed protein product [Thlaspi arvense]|uniref:Uncharacterized protein n=1 Tax=Thlaspi arvense TaxID=13288 RepID=A0AAU9S965_THLAR|nr:unnamed protein product [Thlaspi arvense]
MLKPSMVSFLITLLLAAALCTHGQEPVKDTAGNPVKAGEQYFIQPVKPDGNNGGGLVPAAISVFRFCPLGITQSLLPTQPGLRLASDFYPRSQTPSLTGTVGVGPGIWGTQLVLSNDDAKTILVKIVKVNNDASTATTSASRVEKFGLRMFPFYYSTSQNHL